MTTMLRNVRSDGTRFSGVRLCMNSDPIESPDVFLKSPLSFRAPENSRSCGIV